jgi:ferredoxin
MPNSGWAVAADADLCQAHQMCQGEAPAIFGFDADADRVVVNQDHPDDTLRKQAERAVKECPAMALFVIDTDEED